jgi:carboxynorspermidine decarboxylase
MPAYVVSLAALESNARILREVADAADCRIALALKGFACWKAFPALAPHLDGCCASGLWEARLARDHFGGPKKEILAYSPAYTRLEIAELCKFATQIDFNSPEQWLRFRSLATAHPRHRAGELSFGLRVNPEHSTAFTPLYDPCAPGSRLGATADQLARLTEAELDGITGIHFHTLCEQNAGDLESTLAAVDSKFGDLLRSPRIRHFNMGGGHWITKPKYDREKLIDLVRLARKHFDVDVWLEPGEAAAVHTGVLRATVLDVFESAGLRHAVLDVSASAHMPDILEMPYRPAVFLAERQTPASIPRAPDSGVPRPAVVFRNESYLPALDPSDAEAAGSVAHRLAGPTCLAGDVIGDFAFPRPLACGDTLVFDDMAHYTMVKTTFFNGVPHPDIVLQHPDKTLETIRRFTYEDFRNRLA